MNPVPVPTPDILIPSRSLSKKLCKRLVLSHYCLLYAAKQIFLPGFFYEVSKSQYHGVLVPLDKCMARFHEEYETENLYTLAA